MQYSVTETDEAINDVINFAKYIKYHLGNSKAAKDFVDAYDTVLKCKISGPIWR